MADPLRPLAAPRRQRRNARGFSLLRLAPALTLLLFAAPILAGLGFTLLLAAGYLPALGSDRFSADPWRSLLASPELWPALRLTLTSGLGATMLSFLMVVAVMACCHNRRGFRLLRRAISPLLAVPHAALAIGLAFLLAPSGWIARLLSPWLTGWEVPPDLALVRDPDALALTLALVIKETPFLFLMTLAALHQVNARERLSAALSLGYSPPYAWLKTVMPAIYAQIRLPIFAVLAFSLSVVDMALVLAPTTPPPLAVLIFRWFNHPDLTARFQAAAGSLLLCALVLGAFVIWWLLERAVIGLGRHWLFRGGRGGWMSGLAPPLTGLLGLLWGLAVASLAGLLLWSFARRWRFPAAVPGDLTLANWFGRGSDLPWAFSTTVICGLAATLIALALVLSCLEYEQRFGRQPTTRALWLLYLPLLVPQIGFLFGVQVLLLSLGLSGSWSALIWSHLLFVLPYVFLSLADPYRALDERYARSALCLGAGPGRVFLRIKLPLLLKPILVAAAVGFAVSVAQYLPTLFAGGGRFTTLTTEAVALSAGGNRRSVAVFAVLQSLLPFAGFLAAGLVPALLFRKRRGMLRP